MPETKRKKRLPTTSLEEQKRVLTMADSVIDPPKHIDMNKTDVVFFNNIVDEFARVEWTCHQLELAAMLAKTMADFVEQQDLLRHEGMTDVSAKGTPCVNPRKTVVQMLSSTILSMRKSLALQSVRTGSDLPAKVAAGKRNTKKVEDGSMLDEQLSETDLIARPN